MKSVFQELRKPFAVPRIRRVQGSRWTIQGWRSGRGRAVCYRYDSYKMNIIEDVEQIKSLNLDSELTTFDQGAVPKIQIEEDARITRTEHWSLDEVKKHLIRQVHLIARDALVEYDRNPDERQVELVKIIREHLKKRFLGRA